MKCLKSSICPQKTYSVLHLWHQTLKLNFPHWPHNHNLFYEPIAMLSLYTFVIFQIFLDPAQLSALRLSLYVAAMQDATIEVSPKKERLPKANSVTLCFEMQCGGAKSNAEGMSFGSSATCVCVGTSQCQATLGRGQFGNILARESVYF